MAAQMTKSLDTVREVAVEGARVALRWPYYLNAGFQQHPELQRKPGLPDGCDLDAFYDEDEGELLISVSVPKETQLKLTVNGEPLDPR
jgi:hypothetical protein